MLLENHRLEIFASKIHQTLAACKLLQCLIVAVIEYHGKIILLMQSPMSVINALATRGQFI